MEDRQVGRILQRLHSRESQQAWAEFLQLYSPLIFQVVGFFKRDVDQVAECFLFVCQQLSRKRFRRLRRFRRKGPATFSTWLRAVVRNLCLDWHRNEFGRHRVFQSVARLRASDQEVFRCVYEEGLSLDEAFFCLQTRLPDFSREQLEEAYRRIQQCLTPRQLWLLASNRPRFEPIGNDLPSDTHTLEQQVRDPRPDPEAQMTVKERQARLARAMDRLSKPERLLIRLRFEQGLTLEEIARAAELKDPQSVDRRIKVILEQLRKEMS